MTATPSHTAHAVAGPVLARVLAVLATVLLVLGTQAAAAGAAEPDETASTTGPAGPALAVTLTDDVESDVTPGESFAYTIGVANEGSDEVTAVSMSNDLPSSLAVTGVTAPGPWTCVLPSQDQAGPASLYCTLDELAGGAEAPELTVTVEVVEDVPDDIDNAVEVDSDQTDPVQASRTTAVERAEPQDGEVSASAEDSAEGTEAAALGVDVTDDVEDTVPFGGGSYAYTITVANPGPVELTGVSVGDALPDSVTVTGVTAPGPWTCVLPSEGTTGGSLYCTLESLASGATAPQLTIGVQVVEDFSGEVQNVVEADSDQTDPVRATETTTVDVETRVLGNVLEKPTSAPAADVQASEQVRPELARTGPWAPYQHLAWVAALLLALGTLLLRLARPVTARR